MRLFSVFLVSMALVTLDGFYQLWHGTDFLLGHSVDIPGRFIRMRSTFGSPNDLAAYYLLALPMGFQRWVETRRWSLKNTGLMILFALFSIAFIATLSRAAFFSLFLALLIVAVWRRKKRVIAVIFIAAAAFLAVPGVLRENFVGSLSLNDETIGERIRFWGITGRVIREHPLRGHGVNTYYEEFARHAPAAETYRGYAHNCYLQMWSEVGLIGLLLFVYPIFAIMFKALAKKPEEGEDRLIGALSVGMLAFLIQSAFDTNFYAMQTAHLFWVMWGTSTGLMKG